MTKDRDLLIHRYLEGLLDAGETAEFNEAALTDASFRSRLARAAYDQSNLREFLKADAAPAESAPTAPPRRRFDWRAAVPLAAAALLIVFVATLIVRPGGEFATLTAGQVTADGAPASKIRPGAKIAVVGGKSVELQLQDGSTAELSPASEAVLREDGTLDLSRGAARLKVAGGPRRVVTPFATVIAGRSSFYAELRADGLFVAVLDGSVEIEEGSKRTAVAAGGSHLVRREMGAYELLLGGTKLTLGEAIVRATRSADGAVAVHAELETDKGRVVFSVDIAVGKKSHVLTLDARDGKFVEREDEGDEDCVTLRDAAMIPLAEAVDLALKKAPGRAVEAKMELAQGRPRIDVKIVREGGVVKVRLDGRTGEIMDVKENQ